MTPTCVAPRHVNAPRDFIFLFFYFLRSSSARGEGGGGRCQTLSFSFFPCSADHEWDWPPCKVVFFGLATNVLNVRNNNNFSLNNNNTRGLIFMRLSFSTPTIGTRLHVRYSTESISILVLQ